MDGLNLRQDSRGINSIHVIKQVFDYPNVSPNGTESNTATVPGVRVGDVVIPIPSVYTNGLVYGQSIVVSVDDQVDVTVVNPTGSSLNPPATQEWTFIVLRPS